ncbi:MAG TPA: dihydrofolate reductase family protein [Propionibacteriaceae bacterium]
MRELVYFVAVSLDGFIAAPDGSFDAFSLQGDHLDMIARDYPDTLPAPALQAMGLTPDGSRFDTVLMGWNTYAVGLPFGLTSPYPHLRQVVFSRTRTSPDPSVTVTSESPGMVVARLKRESGSAIWLCGGGQLASALGGVIDRLVLKVNPVRLGSGIPLFAAGDYRPDPMELVTSTAYASGVVVSEYVRR